MIFSDQTIKVKFIQPCKIIYIGRFLSLTLQQVTIALFDNKDHLLSGKTVSISASGNYTEMQIKSKKKVFNM